MTSSSQRAARGVRSRVEPIERRIGQRAHDLPHPSARKLKQITESPSRIVATGWPSLTITVGG
jgi:hypothetical protein